MADEATNDSSQQENPNLDHLREKAEKAEALAEENRLLRTSMAFQQAGIDTTEGQPGALLFSTFKPDEGQDITAESVLEYAKQFGVNPNASQEQAPPAQSENPEQQAQQSAEAQFFQNSNRIGNAGEVAPSDPDPNKSALDTFDARMAEGAQREDAFTAGISEMFAGAARGDRRVVYDQDEWRERNR